MADKIDEVKDNLYEKAVTKVNDLGSAHLHKVTEDFIEKAIQRNNAEDNPVLKRLLTFEIRRRAYGPGQTQDFAEPAVWMVVKTASALAVAVLSETVKNKSLKSVGLIAAVGIILNNVVEAARLTPRFLAGLQGSERMALERWKAIETTGVDPFSATVHGDNGDEKTAAKSFMASVPRNVATPEAIAQQQVENNAKPKSI